MSSSKIPANVTSGAMQSHPVMLEETYYSLIEADRWQGTKVVVKRCRNQNDPRTVVRFRNEVDALKASSAHHHIAKILDSDAAQFTITLRFEKGQSLDKYADSNLISILSLSECSTIWRQMASALAFLHSVSIIHDDVKPDNIMWCGENEHGVLIDFGATLMDMPQDYFNPSGTPSYAPPEFLARKKSAKGDIWGLGITLLFAFGYVPLPGGEWMLPHALDESTEAHKEMLAWLAEVDSLRAEILGRNYLFASMLHAEPLGRIGSDELVEQLGSVGRTASG